MKTVVSSIVVLCTLLGLIYSGGLQMLTITDKKYVGKPYFKSFEARQHVSDLNDEINDANKEIRIYEYKKDSGIKLAPWEDRYYEEAKRRKRSYEDALNKFLHPSPSVSHNTSP